MKIIFLVPYPLKKSPSQRFRFEQYFDALMREGRSIHVQSFLTDSTWDIIYSKDRVLQKVLAVITGLLRRLSAIPRIVSADFVFIHREAAPVGPPAFEWIIARLLRRKIIYDFDDAIWLTDQSNEGSAARVARNRDKVGAIARWSHKVSCGNEYLCRYARQFNPNVVYNPTTIDTNYHRGSVRTSKQEDEIVIGWTGSHTTLKYFALIVPVLKRLEKKYPRVIFEVIANTPPDFSLSSFRFTKWKLESEIEDLSRFDVGIMPLPDDDWVKGKCGFKALQYMALGIPTVASPVGVATTIINNGINGFLCSSEDEWFNAIDRLIQDTHLRSQIGQSGRSTVDQGYSVNSNTSNFLSLFS